MFNISITSDLKILGDFTNFTNKFKSDIIETGLDKILYTSLQKLKEDLFTTINQEIKETTSTKSKDQLDNEKIILPKSDQEILKHLTGLNIPQINRSKDYSTTIQSNVLLVENFRVRLRVPISPGTTFDEAFAQAKTFFNKALFVVKTGMEVSYLKNPGIDISQFVKVVCSRDTGDSDKARKKFDMYKYSKNMPRQESSDIGRYAEWSLKQEAVKQIMSTHSGFVNLTGVVNKIKEGDLDGATEIAQQIQDKAEKATILEKIEELKQNKKVDPTTQAYINLTKLIRNLMITKQIYEDTIIYNLESIIDDTITNIKDNVLYEEIQRHINLWLIENELPWFDALQKKIDQFLDEYIKAN